MENKFEVDLAVCRTALRDILRLVEDNRGNRECFLIFKIADSALAEVDHEEITCEG